MAKTPWPTRKTDLARFSSLATPPGLQRGLQGREAPTAFNRAGGATDVRQATIRLRRPSPCSRSRRRLTLISTSLPSARTKPSSRSSEKPSNRPRNKLETSGWLTPIFSAAACCVSPACSIMSSAVTSFVAQGRRRKPAVDSLVIDGLHWPKRSVRPRRTSARRKLSSVRSRQILSWRSAPINGPLRRRVIHSRAETRATVRGALS